MVKVVLSSTERDAGLSTDEGEYTQKFSQVKKYVNSVELNYASIPKASGTVIAGYNDLLRSNVNGDLLLLDLTPGNYTATQLADHVNTVMNTEVVGNTTMFVTYDSVTNKMSFTANTLITLDFPDQSVNTLPVCDLIGLQHTPDSSTQTTIGANTYTSVNQIITDPLKHCFLDLDLSSGSVSTRAVMDRNHHHSFVVPLDVNTGEVSTYKSSDNFDQMASVNNVSVNDLKIKIIPGLNETADHPLQFQWSEVSGGLDNYFIFDMR